MLGCGGVWGCSFFFIVEALDAFQPMLITFLRVLFGFLTLLAFPKSRRPIERADWGRIALLAVVWMSVPTSMFPIAERHVSSSVAGMLNCGVPIFAAVVATVLLRRLPGRRQRIGIAIGTVGIVMVGIPSFGNGSSEASGVLLILFALACYGLAINLVVPLQQKYGSLPVLCRVAGVAALLLSPFGVASIPSSHFAWHSFLATLALGVAGSAIAFVSAAALAGRVGSTRASTNTYLIPIVSLVLGVLVRDEHVDALAIAGCGMMLIGAFVASRAEAPRPEPAGVR